MQPNCQIYTNLGLFVVLIFDNAKLPLFVVLIFDNAKLPSVGL